MNSVSYTPSFGMAYKVNGKDLAQYLRNNPVEVPEITAQMGKAHEELKDTKHVDVETFITPEGAMRHRLIKNIYYINDDFSVGKDKLMYSPVNKGGLRNLVEQAKTCEGVCEQEYKEISQSSETLKKLDIYAG